jgi:hypothetical protein
MPLSKLYFDVEVHDLSRQLAERSIVTVTPIVIDSHVLIRERSCGLSCHAKRKTHGSLCRSGVPASKGKIRFSPRTPLLASCGRRVPLRTRRRAVRVRQQSAHATLCLAPGAFVKQNRGRSSGEGALRREAKDSWNSMGSTDSMGGAPLSHHAFADFPHESFFLGG